MVKIKIMIIMVRMINEDGCGDDDDDDDEDDERVIMMTKMMRY